MTFVARLLVLAVFVAAAAPARAASDKPIKVGFLAPLTGPLAERSQLVLDGLQSAAKRWSGEAKMGQRPIEVESFDLTGKDASFAELEKAIKRADPMVIVAAPSGAELELVGRLARKTRIPTVLAASWEPRFSLDAHDPVFHFGPNAVDHAIAAALYTEIPLKAAKAAAITDGTPASKNLAAAYLRNLSPRTKDGGMHELPAGEAEAAKRLADLRRYDGVEVVFVATDANTAVRVAKAPGGPTPLFADGLLVPEVTRAASEEARFLVGSNPYLDTGGPKRYRITRREKALPANPLGERGYAAGNVLFEALAATRLRARGVPDALLALGYEEMLGTTLFTEWGQARFFAWNLWEVTDEGPKEIKPTYLPSKSIGILLRFRPASRYVVDPDSMMVVLHYGEEKDRTIDEDLRQIGLSSKGYEADIDAMVQDGILARTMGRINRLFWRNADGTPIPGVSFNITFGTELPEGAKRSRVWEMRIAGDDPRAGGRASGMTAFVFSTFIERTMYRPLALKPGVNREDLDYFRGTYAWGTSVEQNIRCDEIASLMDGFAGALAMTGAHELGHLAGLGHDTESPRSIMNVAEGGGLEPDWGHWVPSHVRTLESRLKRVAPER